MAQVSPKFRDIITNCGRGLSYWCPGCDEIHAISIKQMGRTDEERKTGWDWNGSYDRPTFQPSVLVTGKQAIHIQGHWTGEYRRDPKTGVPLDHCCHTFITNGEVKFLDDCTHALKGQTVPVPDLPPWVVYHREETETVTDQINQDLPEDQKAAAAAMGAVEPAAAPPPAHEPPAPLEPAAAPLETAQDQDQQAGDQAEKPQEDAGKNVQTMTLAFDAEHIAALTAELKGHLDDGFTAIKAEFAQKMDELAEHCEKRIDSLSEVVDAADIGAIKILVDDAKQAVESIRNSGAAGLADRLAKLEMQLRHSL